jgi:hypothetical protein
LERNAARMKGYVQRFTPMQSPDFVPGRSEALTFLFAAIRGFPKSLRKIFEDAAQGISQAAMPSCPAGRVLNKQADLDTSGKRLFGGSRI